MDVIHVTDHSDAFVILANWRVHAITIVSILTKHKLRNISSQHHMIPITLVS